MSEAQELAASLHTLSGDKGKKKKKLYEYDSAALARAALLEVKKKEQGLENESADTLIAKAEASAKNTLRVVESKEQVADLQLMLMRASLTPQELPAFDAQLARYEKAKQRSQRGLMGALARQKKLPVLQMEAGRVRVDASSQADTRVQYLAGLEVKSPKKGTYTQIEVPAPPPPEAPAYKTGESPEELSLLGSLINGIQQAEVQAAPQETVEAAVAPEAPTPAVLRPGESQEDLSLLNSLLSGEQQSPREGPAFLASLLNLRYTDDGRLEVANAPAALVEAVQPVEAPPAPSSLVEEVRAESKKLLLRKKKKVSDREVLTQQNLDLAKMRRAYDREQAEKRKALKKAEREAENLRKKEERRLRNRRIIRSVLGRIPRPHVSRKGLALAAAKLTLPVLGATLPLVIPGAENVVGQNQVMSAMVTGAGLGLMAGLPIHRMRGLRRRPSAAEAAVPGQKKKRRFLPSAKTVKNLLKETTRNVINVGAVGLTILGLAQQTGTFKTLQEIEASFARTAIAAEANTLHFEEYDSARLAFSDPSQLALDVLQGRRPLTDLTYANSVSLLREEHDTVRDGRTAEVVVQAPAMPIIYTDENGQELFRYSRGIMDPITEADLPPNFIQYLDAIEELPSPNTAEQDEQTLQFIKAIEAEIGPLESTEIDFFVARLAKRNIVDKFLEGDAAGGGASTIDRQFFKLVTGYEGADSFINPDINIKFYHPEKYSDKYLLTLMRAIRQGKVIDPATIEIDDQGATGSITSGDKDIVARLCEQMERFMGGKLVAQNPDFVIAYLNNIRMGAIRGREIIGIDGAAQVFYGKPIKELTEAEQIILLSSIPQISKAIRALDLEIQLENRHANNEDDSDVLAAMEKITYTWEQLHDAAIANVEQVDQGGLFATPEVKQAVIGNIERIFRDKEFFMDVPEQFDNDWVEQIEGDIRSQIELPLTLSMQEIGATEGITLSREGIVVKVDLPDEQKPFTFEDADILFQTESPLDIQLQKMIETGMVQKDIKGYTYYEVKVDGKVRWIPAYEYVKGEYLPGLGAVVLDQDGTLLAKYDRTGQALVDIPVRPGSTLKPIIFSFLQYVEGVSPTDKVLDKEGPFDLSTDDYNIQNAGGLGEMGMISWNKALADSRNIPFMRAMHEYFYQGTEKMSEAEQKAILIQRMGVFQDFIKTKFGIKVTDIYGNEVIDPSDKEMNAGQFPIGYGFITAAENQMVEVPDGNGGTTRVLQMERSSLEALGGAFLRMELPEKFFPNDPKMIQAANNTSSILNVLGLNRFKGKDPFDHAWAKTGTLELDIGTTATFTAEVVRKGSEVRVVFIQLRGQTVGPNGEGLEFNMDPLSEAIKGKGITAESFREARPYAEWLVKESLKLHALEHDNSNAVIESLTELAEGKDPDLNMYVLRLNKDTTIVNENGDTVIQLQDGQFVDAIGEVRDGMQPVAISERVGEANVLRTGFVKIEDVEAPDLESTARLNDLMRSEEVQEFIDNDHFFADNNVHFVILDNDVTSPALVTVLKRLQANNTLATTSDELNKVFPAGTIFVNPDRLADFEKENTEATRAMLAREFKQIGVQLQLAEAIHTIDPSVDLDSLLMDKNSATARLMEVLMQGEVPGAGVSSELMLLRLPMTTTNNRSIELKSLRMAENHFNDIMNALQAGRPVDQTSVRGLLAILNQLKVPTVAEEQFLGIAQ